MPTVIVCPQCQRKLRVGENLLGTNVRCPACQSTFLAEAADGAAPAPPPPAGEQGGQYWEQPAAGGEPPPLPSRRRPATDEYDEPPRSSRHLAPHRGTLILVLGILSLVACNILGPVAWVLGNNDLKAIRSGRMDPSGEGLTNAGKICGIVGTCFLILGCVIGILYILFVFVLFGAAAAHR